MVMKVPNIEQDLTEHIANHRQQLAQHQQQIIAVRLSIFKLREGKKIDVNDLKDLLSDVRDFSNSAPQLVKEIAIDEGKQPVSTNLPMLAGVLPESLPKAYPSTSYPLTNPDHIARFIETALLSAAPIEWYADLDSGQLFMSYPGGTVVIRPNSKLSIEDSDALAARLNILRETIVMVTKRVAEENAKPEKNQDLRTTQP
jgi:hypothetical protein